MDRGDPYTMHGAFLTYQPSNFPVPTSCYQSMSMVVLEEPMDVDGCLCEHLMRRFLYPEPEGTYALKLNQHENKNIYRGHRKPVKAYPLISISYRPDLRHGKIIWNK